MANIKQAFEYAAQNPDSEFATNLKQLAASGSLNQEAEKYGIDLSAFQPKPETNLAQTIAGGLIKAPTDLIAAGYAGAGAMGQRIGKAGSKYVAGKLDQFINATGGFDGEQTFSQRLEGQQPSTLGQAYQNQTQQIQQSGANAIVQPLTGQQIRPAQNVEQLAGDVLQTGALAMPGVGLVRGAATGAALLGGQAMSEGQSAMDVAKSALIGGATGGTLGVAVPALESLLGATRQTAAATADAFTGAKNLKTNIQTYLGKQSVAPQLEASAQRLTGSASRMESPTALYNEYFPLAEKALTDIKVDAPISKIGAEIGDAFKSVIDNRRAVGAVMGQELKTVGKLKTDIEPIFVNFETALNEAGLTYNGLTKKMVASDLAKVAPEDIRIIEDFVGELNRIGTKPSVAQIDALISRVTDKINYAKSASGMTSTTNGERLVKATLNSLRNTFDEIPELANYAKARKTYSELSDFIDEGSGFLGKVTQSGDFAKDASLAKSAVQSILNNGKKDWLLKLEGLTDYPALDRSTLALQAMKDAGDFRGLSLLETLSDGAKTMTPSGITSKVFDWAFEKGARTVGGTPAERTRAFLQALESKSLKSTAAPNITTKVTTPASGLKTSPTTKAIKKSNPDMGNTIPQKVKGATKNVDKSIPKELQPLAEEARKYKSAEEFVKAQPKLYHGGTADIKEIKLGKTNFGETFYMSDSADYAKSYGGNNSSLNEIVLDPTAKLADLRKPNIELLNKVSGIISPKNTGKTIKIQRPDGSFVNVSETTGGKSNPVHSAKEIIQGIKDGKAYYAEMPEVKEALKELGFDGMITSESKMGANYGVWNTKKLYTKDQLKKLYEQI